MATMYTLKTETFESAERIIKDIWSTDDKDYYRFKIDSTTYYPHRAAGGEVEWSMEHPIFESLQNLGE